MHTNAPCISFVQFQFTDSQPKKIGAFARILRCVLAGTHLPNIFGRALFFRFVRRIWRKSVRAFRFLFIYFFFCVFDHYSSDNTKYRYLNKVSILIPKGIDTVLIVLILFRTTSAWRSCGFIIVHAVPLFQWWSRLDTY